MNTTLKYPLEWPFGYKRTPKNQITWSQFKQTMDKAQNFLKDELRRLGAKDLVISTDLRVFKSGDSYYAADLNRGVDDSGVAIYFDYKGKRVAMCCDRYNKIWENMYALAKGIEAIRGMERWGVSDFIERAFTGFTALPQAIIMPPDPWDVLGLDKSIATKDKVKERYHTFAKLRHPDVPGGSTEAFQELQTAYEAALRSFEC